MDIASIIALIVTILLGIICAITASIKYGVDEEFDIILTYLFFAGILCYFMIKFGITVIYNFMIIGVIDFFKWLFHHFFV